MEVSPLIKFKDSVGKVKFTEKDDGTIEIYDKEIFEIFKKEGYTNITFVERKEPQ